MRTTEITQNIFKHSMSGSQVPVMTEMLCEQHVKNSQGSDFYKLSEGIGAIRTQAQHFDGSLSLNEPLTVGLSLNLATLQNEKKETIEKGNAIADVGFVEIRGEKKLEVKLLLFICK